MIRRQSTFQSENRSRVVMSARTYRSLSSDTTEKTEKVKVKVIKTCSMLTAPESKPKVKATAAENTIGMCDQDKAHIYYPRF